MALSAYVHVPFCRSRCSYCGFYSGEPLDDLPRYADWIAAELSLRRGEWVGPVETLYFGGGTPALLGPRGVEVILQAVDRAWGLAEDAEITLEANPASGVDFHGFRAAGVNRLSLGIQSLDDALLRALERPHSGGEALEALRAASSAGFGSVSADLLFGLPGIGPESLRSSAAALLDAGAAHVSAYSLELPPGARLTEAVESGAFLPPPPEEELAQWEGLADGLGDLGFRAYEVSNYALPGAECRHNLAYWQGKAYSGLGPGAHGYSPRAGRWGTRSWNEPDLRAYRARIGAGKLPPGGSEALTREQALLEELFLTLRRPVCLDLRELCSKYEVALQDAERWVARAVAEGWLLEFPRSSGSYVPTPSGLRVADGLAAELSEHLLLPADRGPT
jgi:oxygen-independent coproporphyrinogen III oxidase